MIHHFLLSENEIAFTILKTKKVNLAWIDISFMCAVEIYDMLRRPSTIASYMKANDLISHCVAEPYVVDRMTITKHVADRTSLLNNTVWITNRFVTKIPHKASMAFQNIFRPVFARINRPKSVL